jgi:hypothetical protein
VTTRSRVPVMPPDTPPAFTQFLDAIDRRQLTVSQLEQLSGSASNADIIAKINAIIQAHQTK